MTESNERAKGEGLAWQTGVWDRMSGTYVREIDQRFADVTGQVILRAACNPGTRSSISVAGRAR